MRERGRVQVEGIGALREAILRDAAETARVETEQAEAMAAGEAARARQAAEAERSRILRDAEREAQAIRRRTESSAEIEARRRLLELRESLVRQTLEAAMAGLREGIDPSLRRDALLRLIVAAAMEAGGGRLVVRTGTRDGGLLSSGLLSEAEALLAGEGVSADLEAAERPAEISGGAIVIGGGGRVVVDNSLDARLRRLEPALRSEIWRILSGSEEE